MMNWKIRTKLPAIIKPSMDKEHVEAREKDAETRTERKNKTRLEKESKKT